MRQLLEVSTVMTTEASGAAGQHKWQNQPSLRKGYTLKYFSVAFEGF